MIREDRRKRMTETLFMCAETWLVCNKEEKKEFKKELKEFVKEVMQDDQD